MPGAYDQKSIQLHFQKTNERLRAIEAQLKVLSDAAGVSYEQPLAEVPSDVIELPRAGEPLKAAQRYRELTNASSDEAIAVVQGL
jgi:hypothetical protein